MYEILKDKQTIFMGDYILGAGGKSHGKDITAIMQGIMTADDVISAIKAINQDLFNLLSDKSDDVGFMQPFYDGITDGKIYFGAHPYLNLIKEAIKAPETAYEEWEFNCGREGEIADIIGWLNDFINGNISCKKIDIENAEWSICTSGYFLEADFHREKLTIYPHHSDKKFEVDLNEIDHVEVTGDDPNTTEHGSREVKLIGEDGGLLSVVGTW